MMSETEKGRIVADLLSRVNLLQDAPEPPSAAEDEEDWDDEGEDEEWEDD